MGREKRKFQIDDRMGEVYTGSGGRQSLSMPAGLDLYKPKKSGAFRLEIIPFQLTESVTRFAPGLRFARPGTWHWTVIYRMHGGIGPDNASVVCTHQTFGKPCPVCEQKAVLGRSSHPDDKKTASALYARERQLMLVSERDERAGTLGAVQLWEISTFCFKKQLDLFLQAADPEDRDAYAKFWHPDVGLTMKVVGSEESMGEGSGYSKYSVMELKPRREPLPDDIFDHGFDLYAIPRERSYADIKAIFSGVEEEPDAHLEDAEPQREPEDDVPEPPRRSAPVPKTKAPPPEEYPLTDPEPAPPALTFTVGQHVEFTNAQGTLRGVVASVDDERQICGVKVPNRERPVTLDFEELRPVAVSIPLAAPVSAGRASRPASIPATPEVRPVHPIQDDDDIPPPPKRKTATPTN